MARKMIILPEGSNLVNLVAKAVRRGRLPYNYLVAWKDVQGVGLSLAQVDWLPSGQTYVNL